MPKLNLSLAVFKPISIALALLCSPVATAQDSPGPEMGERLYIDQKCYSCHGYNGTGTTPLVNKETGILLTEPGFIAFLRMRAELNPVLPSTQMPNYPAESLSDEDAKALYAYIRSFTDEPPPVGDIPVMQEILDAARN